VRCNTYIFNIHILYVPFVLLYYDTKTASSDVPGTDCQKFEIGSTRARRHTATTTSVRPERRHGVLQVSILRARVRAVRGELRLDDQEEDAERGGDADEFKSETDDAEREGTRRRTTTVGGEREGVETVETREWTTVGGREDAGGEDAGGEGGRNADAGTGVGERDDDDDDDDDGGGSREEAGESG
jgi:hypothetical protein